MKTSIYLVLFLCLALSSHLETARPNILWVSSEDHGPHMGCYGDSYASTPNVDRLAAKGMI
jgi:arylsulfatase A-like enzyme